MRTTLHKKTINIADGEGAVVVRHTGEIEMVIRSDKSPPGGTIVTPEIAIVLVMGAMFEEENQDLMVELSKRARKKLLKAGVLIEPHKPTPEEKH